MQGLRPSDFALDQEMFTLRLIEQHASEQKSHVRTFLWIRRVFDRGRLEDLDVSAGRPLRNQTKAGAFVSQF
jgi:hypothetical protein